MMKYNELKQYFEAVVQGYQSKEFPPRNPYAPFGILPDQKSHDENLLGAAWFYGYWSRVKNKDK
jgi:hypothetical protein